MERRERRMMSGGIDRDQLFLLAQLGHIEPPSE
jgi:hypothetical protein